MKLHDYQNKAIEKIINTKKIELILEMGLGKTIITLKALEYLMFDSLEINKVLVIAPLRVARSVWSDEIEKWGMPFTYSKILGSEKERMDALEKKADIYLVNRENVRWLVEYFLKIKKWPFDTLVIDEASSFKNPSSQRFKFLKKTIDSTRRAILLTGTPSPNGLMDLWPQFYLIDKGERLEKSITSFRNKYFTPAKQNGYIVYSYKIKPSAEDQIYKKIADVSFSLKAVDYIKLPGRVDNFIKIEMDERTKKLYKELEDKLFLEFEDEEITASSAAVLSNKLLQLANGAVYTNDGNYQEIHSLKLDALEEIIEDNNKPIIVFYKFKHDLERLKERLNKYNPKILKTKKDEDDWNAGKIRVLLAQPASMGHGLNMQFGGHVIVWFGLTWSLEEYLQSNARLYRQGQKETVVVNHLVLKGSIDEEVIKRINSKNQTQEDLINYLKLKIEGIKAQKKVF